MIRPVSAAILLLAIAFVACEPDLVYPSVASLEGSWMVKSATRNEKNTGLLQGTYFRFGPNASFYTNLPLREEPGEWESPFEMKEDTLFQKASPAIKYHIKSWSDSTLTLSFNTRGIPFELRMVRFEPADSLRLE